MIDLSLDETDQLWKQTVADWNAEQDRLEAALKAGEDAIEEVRKMNPKPFRTNSGSVNVVKRIGFTVPVDDRDDVIERTIRTRAHADGKIILGRM